MKLATGLWVWGSLLVATGTVQPSASQSGGSRGLVSLFPLAPQLLNPPPPRVAPFSFSAPCHPLASRLEGPEGPWLLVWVAPRSNPNLPLCVCVRVFLLMLQMSPLSCHPRYYFTPPPPSLAPFFLSRAFSGSLSGIASGGARCSGRGRQELVSGGSFLLRLGRGKKRERKRKRRKKKPKQIQTQIELGHLFGHRDVSRLLLPGLPGVQGCSGWSAGREPGLAPELACVQRPARISHTRRGHPGRGARPWQLERN